MIPEPEFDGSEEPTAWIALKKRPVPKPKAS